MNLNKKHYNKFKYIFKNLKNNKKCQIQMKTK